MENEMTGISAPESTKRCSHCKQELPMSNFYRNSSQEDGRSATCKTCINEMAKLRSLKRSKASKTALNPMGGVIQNSLNSSHES